MISRRRRREFSGSSIGQVVVASAAVVDFRWQIRVFAPNGAMVGNQQRELHFNEPTDREKGQVWSRIKSDKEVLLVMFVLLVDYQVRPPQQRNVGIVIRDEQNVDGIHSNGRRKTRIDSSKTNVKGKEKATYAMGNENERIL
ncbi:hypothetical protein RHSIM_Rhsim09G0133800 [Rhododendron simsii]|uniref:Uncharacterized protein n=1 Tax=Rhododendron simsii TaxID=118357 RepID=A0A834LC65_RHOSS|nr:hypothetical protein RHSIM_Rhsim09G0133800 [Rhododendron simsii]